MPPAKPADLPDRYIAVKFYASSACPIRAHHQDVIDQMVRLLAGQIDVVVLHPTTRFDDHAVFAMPKHPRVHHRIFTPATNLDEQTAIIGGAAAFVGTYGGFAYLAPFLGVRTLSFYGIANFRRDHLAVMRTVSAQVLRTPFEAIPLNSGLQTVRTLLTGRSYAAA